MNPFRVLVALIWIALLAVTLLAIQKLGLSGGNVFFADFAHPWRAQFNTDLSAHLILMAVWIVYRESKWWAGLSLAALSLVGGGAFTLGYILVATFRAQGDSRKLLLGKHA